MVVHDLKKNGLSVHNQGSKNPTWKYLKMNFKGTKKWPKIDDFEKKHKKTYPERTPNVPRTYPVRTPYVPRTYTERTPYVPRT